MKRERLAPIALFVYNRLDHTRRTIEALAANNLASESHLVIFADGAKNRHGDPKVDEVREYIAMIDGFASVDVICQDENLGLANSIISGVTKILNTSGKVIVLEDDIVTSPKFLEFMNEALDFYEHNDEVISINAYMYPILDLPDVFFLRASDSWGWATWLRGWKFFEPDGKKLMRQIFDKRLVKTFNFCGYYPYLDMLRDQIAKKNDSWAIRWHASTLVNDKLGLYIGKSLVQNIGLDGTGRHCGKGVESLDNKYQVSLEGASSKVKFITPSYDENTCKKVGQYMSSNFLSIRRRFLNFFRYFLLNR